MDIPALIEHIEYVQVNSKEQLYNLKDSKLNMQPCIVAGAEANKLYPRTYLMMWIYNWISRYV